ncbi:MAG: hypothetical protein BalsKO_28290 [Balneolaceae bacterium]
MFENDCGPFEDKFKTNEFITELKKVSISNNPTLEVHASPLEKDTVSFNEVSISMFPIREYYSYQKIG